MINAFEPKASFYERIKGDENKLASYNKHLNLSELAFKMMRVDASQRMSVKEI